MLCAHSCSACPDFFPFSFLLIVDGFRIIYDREVPLEVRMKEPASSSSNEQTSSQPPIGTLETFRVKILLLGSDDSPQTIRVELSSEADLWFHYTHDIDEHGFSVSIRFTALLLPYISCPKNLIFE